MPRIGLEPTHLTAPEPKSGVSTSFTIWAFKRKETLADLALSCQAFCSSFFIFFEQALHLEHHWHYQSVQE